MRKSLAPVLCRTAVCALVLVGTAVPGGARAVAPTAPPSPERSHIPFTERYRAYQHGGIVRAANVSISCRAPKGLVRKQRAAKSWCPSRPADPKRVNGAYDMAYVDVDKDRNTYNSSRAEVRLPKGSRVSYARLYWGGNLRVGEQKPPRDNGRVLIAEPGGQYKELLADTLVGHRVAHGADAYQASADVTRLVRDSGPGLYTVAQVNVAMGRSSAGAWGGWTLVVAYENAAAPLRHLLLWDGFDTPANGVTVRTGKHGLRFPAGAAGRAGLVTYDGDRGVAGDMLTALTTRTAAGRRHTTATALKGPGNPRNDVLNSTISEPGRTTSKRVPFHVRTLGYDSDILDLAPALRHGGDRLALRLRSPRDRAWAGVLFVTVDARR